MEYSTFGISTRVRTTTTAVACPKYCGHENVISNGSLTLKNGGSQPVFKCTNCNTAWSEIPLDIRELIENGADSEKVTGYTYASESAQKPLSVSVLENKMEDQTLELQNIRSEISELVRSIYNLIDENKRLTAKLESDPLIGMRKKISEFDLK